MTFVEFELRVKNEPDLVLSPIYWNNILPETAPTYFSWIILQELSRWLHQT